MNRKVGKICRFILYWVIAIVSGIYVVSNLPIGTSYLMLIALCCITILMIVLAVLVVIED